MGVTIPGSSCETDTNKHRSFVHSVLVLCSGTVLSYLLQAIALPVLTRIYSPSDFQTAAVFQSLLFIFSIAACFRFDTAVSLGKERAEVLRLVVLSILCCVLTSTVMALILLVAPRYLWLMIGDEASIRYFWLLPIGILLVGAVSTFQSWHIREKSFKALSFGKMAQTTSLVVAQIGLGLASVVPFGLICGNLIQGTCLPGQTGILVAGENGLCRGDGNGIATNRL